MNKRSATFIAATLVGVLAIGGAAFSLGLTGPTASAASERTTTAKPIVRTHTKTVVVHRQAPPAAPGVVFVSSNSGPSAFSGPGDEGTEGDNEDHGEDQEGPDDQGDHDDQQSEDDNGGEDD
ncbi:MAG: hypothetical protein ABI595_10250 [Actinomycetota bacterium]